jgi:chemotaxis regulatin CheY-phosphate phosphatase CheZ
MTATIDQMRPTDFMIHQSASIINKTATTNENHREEIAQLTRRLRTMKRKLLLEHAKRQQQEQLPKADSTHLFLF